jgi:hypothetical protein
VRGVNKKELMHASNKVLECTFQVRATNVGLSALSSNVGAIAVVSLLVLHISTYTDFSQEQPLLVTATTLDLRSPIHLLRRAHELQREIAREEALLQGAENQLSLVQDTNSLQYSQLQLQAQNCAARLEGYKLELARVEEDINAAGGREYLVSLAQGRTAMILHTVKLY